MTAEIKQTKRLCPESAGLFYLLHAYFQRLSKEGFEKAETSEAI